MGDFKNADLWTKNIFFRNLTEKYRRNEGFKTVDSYKWERNHSRYYGPEVALYSILIGCFIGGCILILKICFKWCKRQSVQEYPYQTIITPPPPSSNQCNYFKMHKLNNLFFPRSFDFNSLNYQVVVQKYFNIWSNMKRTQWVMGNIMLQHKHNKTLYRTQIQLNGVWVLT